MSLFDKMKVKYSPAVIATAIPAIPATYKVHISNKIAKVAAVAVANTQADKLPCKNIAEIKGADWLICFSDGRESRHLFSYQTTRTALQAVYPDALSIEPYQQRQKKPDTLLEPLHAEEIRKWLQEIGEHDQLVINDVVAACREDADARVAYFRLAGISEHDH